jgi:hypothetical protein
MKIPLSISSSKSRLHARRPSLANNFLIFPIYSGLSRTYRFYREDYHRLNSFECEQQRNNLARQKIVGGAAAAAIFRAV